MKNTVIIGRSFLKSIKQKRAKRILFISLIIGVVWCLIDLMNDNLTFNLWHDLFCLLLGIIVERIIPWEKIVKSKSQELISILQELLNDIFAMSIILSFVSTLFLWIFAAAYAFEDNKKSNWLFTISIFTFLYPLSMMFVLA